MEECEYQSRYLSQITNKNFKNPHERDSDEESTKSIQKKTKQELEWS